MPIAINNHSVRSNSAFDMSPVPVHSRLCYVVHSFILLLIRVIVLDIEAILILIWRPRQKGIISISLLIL